MFLRVAAYRPPVARPYIAPLAEAVLQRPGRDPCGERPRARSRSSHRQKAAENLSPRSARRDPAQETEDAGAARAGVARRGARHGRYGRRGRGRRRAARRAPRQSGGGPGGRAGRSGRGARHPVRRRSRRVPARSPGRGGARRRWVAAAGEEPSRRPGDVLVRVAAIPRFQDGRTPGGPGWPPRLRTAESLHRRAPREHWLLEDMAQCRRGSTLGLRWAGTDGKIAQRDTLACRRGSTLGLR